MSELSYLLLPSLCLVHSYLLIQMYHNYYLGYRIHLLMLYLFHLVLYMLEHFFVYNYWYCKLSLFIIHSPPYYIPCNCVLLYSYNPNFMPHLYIINSTFMPHLSSYSIIHSILNYLDLLLLSLSLMLPLLVSSFTNNMLLLILHLYISTSPSDSLTSMSMYL